MFSVYLTSADEESGVPVDIPAYINDRGKSTFVESAPKQQPPSPSLFSRARPHSRQRRQIFDGLQMPGPILRDIESFSRALQDEFVPSSTQPTEGAEEPVGEVAVDPAAVDPSQALQPGQFIQPGFPQVAQFPQVVQPGFPYFPQPGFPQFYQPFPGYAPPFRHFGYPASPFVPYPQYIHPAFQQIPFPPVQGQGNSAAEPPKVEEEAEQEPPATMNRAAAAAAPADHHEQDAVKRIGGAYPPHSYIPPDTYPGNNGKLSFFARYRDRVRRRQQKSSWLKRMFGRFGRKKRDVTDVRFDRKKRDVTDVSTDSKILHRQRRGIVATLQRLFGGKQIVGVLDRMMEGTDDSLYPYTRAALMGYTGTTETCEELYPDCPTSMDELIETFNNLHSYFPNGIPFRDRIPAPFRYLVP